MRAARTVIWATVALAAMAYLLADADTRGLIVAGTLGALASMGFEHHLIDRYLIEILADEIVYLTVITDPGRSAAGYTAKLATIPPHETQKALHRLEDAQRLRAERQTPPTGQATTVYYRHD